ncbi:MAG TPA: tetratricopeptide repeat protein [Candidatus Wallbacteria bacterium]|nr:tetratricopeptide repeat protein [Candidatus Wallbacteria bacterium]
MNFSNIREYSFLLQYPYNIFMAVFCALVLYYGMRSILFILKYNELDRRIAMYPNLAEVRVQLGELLYDNGRVDRSISLFLQAINIHPDLHYARIKLSEIYFERGEKDKAVAQLKEILKRTSDDKYKFSVLAILKKWRIPQTLIEG